MIGKQSRRPGMLFTDPQECRHQGHREYSQQTRMSQQLKREGYPFTLSDAKHLSSYVTRHLLRFGKFALRCETDPLPENLRLDP